jgi:hypothetical protein
MLIDGPPHQIRFAAQRNELLFRLATGNLTPTISAIRSGARHLRRVSPWNWASNVRDFRDHARLHVIEIVAMH